MQKINIELENLILTKLLDGKCDASNKLAFNDIKPEYFQIRINQDLYKIIVERYMDNKSFNIVDLITEHSNDEQLYQKLEFLLPNVYNPVYQINENYISKLQDYYFTNTLLNNTEKILLKHRNSNQINPTQLKSDLKDVGDFSENKVSHGSSLNDLVDKFYYEEPKQLYLKTNISLLDDYLGGGLAKGTLTTLAAEPGVGKTYYGMYLLDQILQANPDTQALFFSLEMEKRKLYERFISLKAKKFKSFCTIDEYDKAALELKLTNIKIFDTKDEPDCSSIEYIRMISSIENNEKKLSVILVDYLAIVQISKKFEREDLRISEIVRQLTKLSIQIDCVVIILVHTNRNAQTRKPYDRAPLPYDEASSQATFRSSSVWIGLDKPSRHVPNDTRLDNLFVLRCAKNRDYMQFYISTKFHNGTYEKNYFPYDPDFFDTKKLTNNYD